jgi:hypothetical protein
LYSFGLYKRRRSNEQRGVEIDLCALKANAKRSHCNLKDWGKEKREKNQEMI